MTFKEAIKKLKIEEYEQRILDSSSCGELSHLADYVFLAENVDETGWFKEWFVGIVKMAEEVWKRPELIFLRIPSILQHHIEYIMNNKIETTN